MNSQRINDQIKTSAESAAKLDFADLLNRIEADGGKSTAPQMTVSGVKTGRIIGVAAGIVAVAALSAVTVVGLNSATKMEASYAADVMDAEAPSCEEPSDSFYSETEMITDSAAPTENDISAEETPEDPETSVSDGDVSDSDVSDSDVSDSDASGSDIAEDE